MMVVDVESEPEVDVGIPELLFEGPFLGSTVSEYRSYDITPDGKRFIAVGKLSEPEKIHIVFDWFDELQRLVPAEN